LFDIVLCLVENAFSQGKERVVAAVNSLVHLLIGNAVSPCLQIRLFALLEVLFLTFLLTCFLENLD